MAAASQPTPVVLGLGAIWRSLCEQLLSFPLICFLFSCLAGANPSLICFPVLKSRSPPSQPWGWGRTDDAWRPCEPCIPWGRRPQSMAASLCHSHLSYHLGGMGRPSWGQALLCQEIHRFYRWLSKRHDGIFGILRQLGALKLKSLPDV